MEKFCVQGGASLKGEVRMSGSKNSAASIIPAAILTNEDCVVKNVPQIEDVLGLLEIMEKMGAKIKWRSSSEVLINASGIDPDKIDFELVARSRMSLLVTGALLSRFGKVVFVKPGGCSIGSRPIATHLKALERFGAKKKITADRISFESIGSLKASKIILGEMSVTATENTLLAAALIPGTTEIHQAALEPHVQELAKVLTGMGAVTEFGVSHQIKITGQEKLSGFEHTLIADPIEVGTFIVASAITGGEVFIKGADLSVLELETLKFKEAGVKMKVEKDGVLIKPSLNLKAVGKVQALPYPGFSSDLLAPFAVLMTQAKGTTLIHEALYEGRLRNYIPELQRMGANTLICDPHRAVITGKTDLVGQPMISFDLRAGATLILAALIAEGESSIENISQIDRGYEKIDQKLRGLGAKIKRVSE
ncbi:UDP-N-acetylglucosamine 1-carboxyvinyltransferase [Patescibacteria group bacterium]|nr:UDP-N-acetylglucosamine 1-carboxyvinyltransferase [Patescibacteria group bacterium]